MEKLLKMNTENNSNKLFWLYVLFGGLLLVSWLASPTSFVWAELDVKSFFFFNSWIANSYFAQTFWAITNTRMFDLAIFFIMLLPFCIPNQVFKQNDPIQHWIRIAIIMLTMVVLRFAISFVVDSQRLSPSLSIEPANLLHELVPNIDAKDKSHNSFPGDHAAVIFCWLMYLILYAKPRWVLIATPVAIFLTLPRLVSGAHWLTDDIVGGMSLTAFTIGLICYTPIGQRLNLLFSPIANQLWSKIKLQQ